MKFMSGKTAEGLLPGMMPLVSHDEAHVTLPKDVLRRNSFDTTSTHATAYIPIPTQTRHISMYLSMHRL